VQSSCRALLAACLASILASCAAPCSSLTAPDFTPAVSVLAFLAMVRSAAPGTPSVSAFIAAFVPAVTMPRPSSGEALLELLELSRTSGFSASCVVRFEAACLRLDDLLKQRGACSTR
jgi:hypothetical protein